MKEAPLATVAVLVTILGLAYALWIDFKSSMQKKIELKQELLRQAIAFEVHKHKWLESEKVGYDVGYDYAWIDWNSKYRKDFVRSRKIAA